MWTRIVLKPWWARALAWAGVYAILNTAGWCADGLAAGAYQSWFSTLAWHVASIVIFGLVVAAFTSNAHRAYTNALACLDPAQRSAAIDASFRGPFPVDAPVRDAAIRVGQLRLESARFWRVMWLVLLCWVVGWQALFAIGPHFWNRFWNEWDPDHLTGFAVCLFATVAAWYVSLSVMHRLQTLRRTGDFDVKSMGEARRGLGTI
jgi:hypothetical protein